MNHHERVIRLSLEAIATPSLWPRALLAFADAAGCSDATVIGYKPQSSTMAFALIGGRFIKSEDLGPYLSYYGRLDPMRDVFGRLPSGTFAASHEALSTETLNRNEFIQEYLIPPGGRHYGGWSFAAPDTHDVLGIALHCQDAPLDRKVFLRLSDLANHLGRAIRQSIRIAEVADTSTCLRNALNKIGIAFVLVDGESLILDVSEKAAAVLEQGLHLRIDRRGRLIAASADDTTRLGSLVLAAAQGSQGGIMSVTGTEQGALFVQVCPCGVTGENPFQSMSSHCALIVIKRPAGAIACEPGRVRAALGCSTAEAEVAAALASGRTPTQVAATRGVSVTTVRSQIRALMAITETSRIIDLVTVILSFC